MNDKATIFTEDELTNLARSFGKSSTQSIKKEVEKFRKEHERDPKLNEQKERSIDNLPEYDSDGLDL